MTHVHTSPRFQSPAQRLRLHCGVTVELYVPHSNDQLHEHDHEHDCLNLVLEGCLYERVHHTLHQLPAGSVSVLPRGVNHAIRVAGRNARVLHLEYDAHFMARLAALDRKRFGFLCWLDPHSHALAQRAREALLHADACSSLQLEALALDGMALALRQHLGDASSSIPAALQALAHSWQQEPGRPLQLAREAAALGLSAAALSRQFRRHFGMRLGDWVLARRIDAACRLLGQPGLSLTHIATTLGFADQSHFCRSFQRALGLSPGAYRRQCCPPQ